MPRLATERRRRRSWCRRWLPGQLCSLQVCGQAGGSIKPCSVLTGANINYELTFGLGHSRSHVYHTTSGWTTSRGGQTMTKWAQRDASPDQVKQEKGLPFNQRIRINVFRVLGAALFPPALFIRPYFDKTAFGGFLEQIGIILIIACVLGRCWAILYIGGNKNRRLVTAGPYSLCRNPLYLFSIMGVVGFGFVLQSLVYAVVLTSVTVLIFYRRPGRKRHIFRMSLQRTMLPTKTVRHDSSL